MANLREAALVATALVLACAGGRPERRPAAASAGSESAEMPGWPETWRADFALRCSAGGEDVRFCTCVADEIRRTSTPEEFRSRGPEGLREAVATCRRRMEATDTR